MKRHLRRTILSSAVAVTVMLAGCSSSSTERRAAGATPQTVAPPTVAVSGDLRGITVSVLSLIRNPGDTVTARFRVANTGNASFGVGPAFIDPVIVNPNLANDVGGMTLTDAPRNRKYLVLLDSRQKCICSDDLNRVEIAPGASIVIFAEFPAPPTSTRAVRVTLPHFPPIDGVPIRAPGTPTDGTGDVPGISVSVVSLVRGAGDIVTGRFRVTNTSGSSTNLGPDFIDPAIINANVANDAGGIALLDAPNNKKYLVLRDQTNECLCSRNLNRVYIAPGASAEIFAKFPASPISTRSVQVTVPQFPPFANVAIKTGAQ